MSSGKGKKLVYVSESLLDEAAKVSRDEDVSLGKLVETCLAQAVKINKLGYKSEQMAEFFNVLESNRVLGGLFVPSGVLDFMISKCNQKDVEQLRSLWSESGQWTGKYLAEKFTDPVDTFKHFLELSRWDINEVDVTRDALGSVKIRFVSTVISLENTVLLSKFVEGVLVGLGYTVENTDAMKGITIVKAKKA